LFAFFDSAINTDSGNVWLKDAVDVEGRTMSGVVVFAFGRMLLLCNDDGCGCCFENEDDVRFCVWLFDKAESSWHDEFNKL
jgi:hypothetical protein